MFSAIRPAKQIKFMTYNVWSREDVVLYTRMQAIGRLVHDHSPDVIFFQFSKLPLKRYRRNAVPAGTVYHEAYSDDEACPHCHDPASVPIPPASMHLYERYCQAERLLARHSGEKNVVVGGDMSWDDKADLPFPLLAGWVDAACTLGQQSWTYDAFWNEKAPEFNGCVDYESMKKRSDRFVCKLQDYKLYSIHVIGDEPVGVDYRKKLQGIKFALRPSCHRGLVLIIVPK